MTKGSKNSSPDSITFGYPQSVKWVRISHELSAVMKGMQIINEKLKSSWDCLILNKACWYNMPQCKAEQSMLKVVAPTVSVIE